MTGLTIREVQDRVEQGLTNEAVDSSTGSVQSIVKRNVFTYFNLIFTVLAVLLILAGSTKDLSFMLIVIANTVIGIVQEVRSKNTLDNLKFDKMPRVVVIRDGKKTEVPSETLVQDDVIVLGPGNQIPADAVVADGSVQVNESLITGESDEITKVKGDELLSGSFIISGECAAVLTAVGKESYISRLTIEATRQEKNDSRSQMVRSLDHLVLAIGILIIPIGGLLLYQQYFVNEIGFRESIISMVAAVLGMIPEGLYMMASIAMVVSAVRLANNEVLVQNMRCIETLARVDVLCVDKTGTITENEMKVTGMHMLIDNFDEGNMRLLIGDLAASMNRDNITMAAIQDYFSNTSGRQATGICPFSSRYKYSGVSYEDGNFVLGAPENVLGNDYAKFEEAVMQESMKGRRVMAFAFTKQIPDGSPLGPVRPLALVVLENPVRESAKSTFEYFAASGVEIKVISGDNPVTVSNVAEEAGIRNADRYIDARGLESQQDIDRAVMDYTVFGRVTPEQKRLFVQSLKKQGKTVGMTGDGVNDVLALRDADTSIALASGSEAASSAAQLVLMDSDFSRMPSVVAEGRRVVNNIIKTASLYLTKNIFSFLLAIFSVISTIQYPLEPSQITLISMFTIGIPSFILSLEPNKARIKGSFLANVFKIATPAGITIFLSVSGLVLFGRILDIQHVSISTAASGLVALGEFLILARVAKPMNRLHTIMLVVMVCGFFYTAVFHSHLFGISPMNRKCVLLLLVFLLATEALFRYFYIFTNILGLFMTKEGRAKLKALYERQRKKQKDALKADGDNASGEKKDEASGRSEMKEDGKTESTGRQSEEEAG